MNKPVIIIIGLIFVFSALFSSVVLASDVVLEDQSEDNKSMVEKGTGLVETLIENSENTVDSIAELLGVTAAFIAAILIFLHIVRSINPKAQKYVFYIVAIILFMYAIGVFD